MEVKIERIRLDSNPLGNLLHSSRQDFEDHKDTGGEGRGGAKGDHK